MAQPRKLAVPVQMDKAEIGFLLKILSGVDGQLTDYEVLKVWDNLKKKLEAARKSLDD